MKAVLDVGQYVSAAINAKGHPAQILLAWRNGAFELYSSYPILDDLRRVLFYPHIRKRLSRTDEEIDHFVASLAVSCHITPAALTVQAVKADPDDDKILTCAIEGYVDYIVASDEHLTSLGSYEGIPIVPPRRFLEIIASKPKNE